MIKIIFIRLKIVFKKIIKIKMIMKKINFLILNFCFIVVFFFKLNYSNVCLQDQIDKQIEKYFNDKNKNDFLINQKMEKSFGNKFLLDQKSKEYLRKQKIKEILKSLPKKTLNSQEIKKFRSLNNHELEKLVNQREKDSFIKKLLREYYIYGAYEEDLEKISENAKNHFLKLPVTKKSMIIFDIDDTLLMSYPTYNFEFIWQEKYRDILKKVNEGYPLKPMLNLYKALVKKGFKIAFITARNVEAMGETFKQLLNAGYNKFDYLLLKPKFVKEIDFWKFQQRKFLSNYYNIVGCIGDHESDCAIGLTGKKIILPNFLY